MELQEEASRVKNIFSQKRLGALMGVNFPSPDKDLLESLVKMYRDLEGRIKESDGLVRKLYSELREAHFIGDVTGYFSTRFFRICPSYLHNPLSFPFGNGVPDLTGTFIAASQTLSKPSF